MNPFRSLVDLALELRKEILCRYVTDNPPTQEEAAATGARLRALAADCRVAARRMGCDGGEKAIDTLLQATVDLFNAPAQLRDPFSRANCLAAAVPPVSKLVDDYEAELREEEKSKRRPAKRDRLDHKSSERSVPGGAVEALLGEESQQILQVARSDGSADQKMRDICRIDRRFLGYESPQWAELLGVTDAAVRKTPFWRRDRQQAIEADRELRNK